MICDNCEDIMFKGTESSQGWNCTCGGSYHVLPLDRLIFKIYKKLFFDYKKRFWKRGKR